MLLFLQFLANTSGYKSDSSTNSDSGTHIPRFTGLTNKKKKPVTPGENGISGYDNYILGPGSHPTKSLKIRIILTFSYLHYKN